MDKGKLPLAGSAPPCVRILGCRGVPAAHGGFETFAERLAGYLAARGWVVTVYCQGRGRGPASEDRWRGIRRVHVPVQTAGALGTMIFDWKSTLHALGEPGVALTLGYNTAIFTALYRLRRIPNVINMDGIEWKRTKRSIPERLWLYANERLGCSTRNGVRVGREQIRPKR